MVGQLLCGFKGCWRYFLVILLLWWLNLFNFMDGIDGLAGVQTLSMTLTASLLLLLMLNAGASQADYQLHILLLMLTASTAGFLVWNWSPARIFLGDVGSVFLGYMLGVLALYSANNQLLSVWSWLILGGVFFTDSTFTLLRRIINKQPWYQAHRVHAYQKVVEKIRLHFENNKGVSKAQARAKAHALVCYFVLGIKLYLVHPEIFILSLNSNFKFWFAKRTGLAIS